MQSEHTPHARRYWAALIFLLLGTLAGVWHNRRNDQGQSDFVVGAVRGTIAPPANLLGRVSHWFGDQMGWMLHGYGLAAENRYLKARVDALEQENASLREARVDYERLRADLGFVPHAGTLLLAADVIARRADPKFDTIVISRGSRDGLHPNSVVVTRNGLVGHVFEVTPGTASVLLLTDQHSGVGARVQRGDSRATGICEGDYSPLLSMIALPNDANIKIGDGIVTSGLGGVYPPGLVVGTITEIKADEGNVGKTVLVHPGVDFDRLEEVYVVP
jgi:rod shape-determining protein MreC